MLYGKGRSIRRVRGASLNLTTLPRKTISTTGKLYPTSSESQRSYLQHTWWKLPEEDRACPEVFVLPLLQLLCALAFLFPATEVFDTIEA